jgi:hypothetical protein
MAFLDRVQADQGPTWLTESSPLFLTCNVQKRSRTGCWPPWRGFATHTGFRNICNRAYYISLYVICYIYWAITYVSIFFSPAYPYYI